MIQKEEEQLLILEEHLIKLILEFLSSKEYHISLRTLERESNVINCDYSDEVLFLRQLVLDGDFEEVLEFGTSFLSNPAFDENKFNYIVLRQKFIELIYDKCHVLGKQNIDTVGDVMKTLSRLEKCCLEKEEYNNLCWLLTLPNLNSHEDFKEWNLDVSRLNCFNELLNCLSTFMPLAKKQLGSNKTSSGNRLMQLIVKGLFYEACTEYCQTVSTGSFHDDIDCIFNRNVLECNLENDFSSTLLSWLRCLPLEVFQCTFPVSDVNVCYSKLNGKKIHYARNIGGIFEPKTNHSKPHQMLARQLSEPNKRDTVRLSGTKSKSFDLNSPNILSSSLPISTMKSGLYGKNEKLKTREIGTNLQSSFTAGGLGLSKPLDKQFVNLSLQSPNVPPVMSSTAFDMSPAVSETDKAFEEKFVAPLQTMPLSPKEKYICNSVGEENVLSAPNASCFISKISQSNKESSDNVYKKTVSKKLSSELPDDHTPHRKSAFQNDIATRKSKDESSSQSHHETKQSTSTVNDNFESENINIKSKKSAVAFELFDSKPLDKAYNEERRREEVLSKLKIHEQNRQDSLKVILSDMSPGLLFI